jgi:hypothetical protein
MQTLQIPAYKLDEFCAKWKVTDLSVGHPNSLAPEALSLYARFDPMAEWSLVDRIAMQEELQRIVGRPVTIQNRHADLIRRGKPRPMQAVFNA